MPGLEDLSHNFLTGRLEDLVKWARRNSMSDLTVLMVRCADAAGSAHGGCSLALPTPHGAEVVK